MNKQTPTASSRIAGEFTNFVSDVEDLVKQTTSLTGEELTQAKLKLSQRLTDAKNTVSEFGGAVAARAKKTADATNDYVQNEPWKAVGIGAAFGLLLGVVLSRR
jgi:ElaB/YqjD/DUF883 family membrane-anchored ribosome-binding protein